MGFRQRSPKNREILGKHIDHTPVDRAPASDHTIPCRALFFHAKIGTTMRDKHVEFFKAAFVKQQINAFACGQFSFGMLRVNPCLTAPQTGNFAAAL